MTRNVVTVSSEDSLCEAFDLMRTEGFRHLPVVDGNRLIGVLSDRDVLLRAEPDGEQIIVPEENVEQAMSLNPITCGPRSSISDAARVMNERKISCLPVVETDGTLIGLITATDLLDLLCQYEEVRREDTIPVSYRLTPMALWKEGPGLAGRSTENGSYIPAS